MPAAGKLHCLRLVAWLERLAGRFEGDVIPWKDPVAPLPLEAESPEPFVKLAYPGQQDIDVAGLELAVAPVCECEPAHDHWLNTEIRERLTDDRGRFEQTLCRLLDDGYLEQFPPESGEVGSVSRLRLSGSSPGPSAAHDPS
jgi:hypothetical protein